MCSRRLGSGSNAESTRLSLASDQSRHLTTPAYYSSGLHEMTKINALIVSYLRIDWVKTVMIYDPFSWCQAQERPHYHHHLPALLTTPIVRTYPYRMMVALIGIWTALKYLSASSRILEWFLLRLPPEKLSSPSTRDLFAIGRLGSRDSGGIKCFGAICAQ